MSIGWLKILKISSENYIFLRLNRYPFLEEEKINNVI
jgi:hypothetical protein